MSIPMLKSQLDILDIHGPEILDWPASFLLGILQKKHVHVEDALLTCLS